MNPPTAVVSLSSLNLLRPEKIRWISSLQPGQSVLDSLNSKSLRKFLTHADERCQENDILVEILPMTAERYAQWHEFYCQEMLAWNHEIIAQPDWLAQKEALGQSVTGIFYTQRGEFIGGSVILETPDYMSLAYKANKRLELSNDADSSLGAILEFDYLRFAQPKGKLISSGRCRNAFGVHNTLGYLAFKLRFGYQATLPDEPVMLNEVPVAQSGKVLFFARSPGESSLLPYFFTPTPDNITEFSEVQRKLPDLTVLKTPDTIL